jgi:hypothetical protein
MNVFLMQNSIVRPLGRDMQNVLIGFVGEHEARTFFVRTRDDLTGYTVGLVIDDVDCGAMTKAPMPDGSIMLSLTLTSDMLGKGGDKVCQLIMTKDTIVRKSSQFRAYVGASNDINSTAPDSATIIIISEKITELVHEAALDAIAEVQEVIDSIPADYSELSDQVEQNTEDIGGLRADLGAHGFTDAQKNALLACFNNVVWKGTDGDDYYQDLYDALYPPATLSYITCAYTQSGTVYNTDTLDSLKSDLVVTAHMNDGSTRTVTTYTLSGTLTVGTSTITVSYGGKTVTFTVTVTQAPLYPFENGTHTFDTYPHKITVTNGNTATIELSNTNYDCYANISNVSNNGNMANVNTNWFNNDETYFTLHAGETLNITAKIIAIENVASGEKASFPLKDSSHTTVLNISGGDVLLSNMTIGTEYTNSLTASSDIDILSVGLYLGSHSKQKTVFGVEFTADIDGVRII